MGWRWKARPSTSPWPLQGTLPRRMAWLGQITWKAPSATRLSTLSATCRMQSTPPTIPKTLPDGCRLGGGVRQDCARGTAEVGDLPQWERRQVLCGKCIHLGRVALPAVYGSRPRDDWKQPDSGRNPQSEGLVCEDLRGSRRC